MTHGPCSWADHGILSSINDIGEGLLLQKATERLTAMEAKVLERNIAGSHEEIFEMRRKSIRVARDI